MKKSLWKRFLCLMFSVIVAVAIVPMTQGKDIQAASSGTFTIGTSGSVNTISPFTMNKGDSKTFSTVNKSNKIMKVTYDFSWTGGSNSTGTYLSLYMAGSYISKSDLNNGRGKNTVYLYPGETYDVKMKYDSFAYKSCTVTLTAKAEAVNDTITEHGDSSETATPVSFGTKIKGLYKGSGMAEKHYYKLTLDDKYYLNATYSFSCKPDTTTIPVATIYDSSGNKILTMNSSGKTTDTKLFEKGTYLIEIDIKAANNFVGGGFLYDLQFGGRKWIHATGIRFSPASLTVDGSKTSLIPFSVVAKTIPENSDDKLLNVEKKLNCLTSTYENINKNSETLKGAFIDMVPVGRQHCFTVTTTNGIRADYYATITIPNASKPTRVTTTYDSATIEFAYPRRGGTKIHLQQKKGSKWVTVKTINPSSAGPSSKVTVKKLKALSSYQFRTIIQGGNSYGKPSAVVTAKTGSKEKPKIQSIKTSNFKKIYVPKEYHPGHWAGNVWIKGYYTGGYSYTKYKVTVTLKKNVSKTNGLYINSQVASQKGKTYSVYLTGGKKGSKKTIKIQTLRDKKARNGVGPTVTKKVTIR